MIKVPLLNGQSYGVTDRMQGKMKNMWSLNTSAEYNPFCKKMRQVEGAICRSCYSRTTERRYVNSQKAWENNYHVLSENVLKDSEIIRIDKLIFRFQAHGDLVNRRHYLNMVKIAEANPKTTFALWTKRLSIINRGGLVKLDNLIYVFSTLIVNTLNPMLPKGFTKVFSVFDKKFAAEKEIAINCGAKACATCRLCYEHNDIVEVNELVK